MANPVESHSPERCLVLISRAMRSLSWMFGLLICGVFLLTPGWAQEQSAEVTIYTMPADLTLLGAPRFYQQQADGQIVQIPMPRAGGQYYVTSILLNRGPGAVSNIKVNFVAETVKSKLTGDYVIEFLPPGESTLVSTWISMTDKPQNVGIWVESPPEVPDQDLSNNGAMRVVSIASPHFDFSWLAFLMLALAAAALIGLGVYRLLLGRSRNES